MLEEQCKASILVGVKQGVLAEILVKCEEGILDKDVKGIARKVDEAFNELEAGNNKPAMFVLTREQIDALAKFAHEDGQPAYTICRASIPACDEIEEYDGLIAFSESKEHGVLQLD